MRQARCAKFEPLDLVAVATWGLIAFEQVGSAWNNGGSQRWGVIATLLVFLLAFLLRGATNASTTLRISVLLQLAAALANVGLIQSGSGPILGVIVAAQLPFAFGFRTAVGLVLAALAVYGWVFAEVWQTSRPWFTSAMYGGFQFFALLTARLAHTAERQRDELAEVNAHLIATRSLLEAGARDGERLRLSRELHDVAGHSLTALKLNLELALRLPEAERGVKIEAARSLVDGLLEDIRAVVGQLRRHDGVDLAPVLRALTERIPGPRVALEIEPELRVADVTHAEALLRCVQEGLTNALRHAGASRITVAVRREADAVRVEIEDDGRGRADIAPGHGLTGMRERIEEAGGRLDLDTAPGRGFRIRAVLPQAAA